MTASPLERLQQQIQVRWEPGQFTSGVSRFARIVVWRLCFTTQWDLLSRREWEIWTTVTWGSGDPSYRKDYVRLYLGPGVIPF